jgi:hypothetical protein
MSVDHYLYELAYEYVVETPLDARHVGRLEHGYKSAQTELQILLPDCCTEFPADGDFLVFRPNYFPAFEHVASRCPPYR